MTEMKSFSIVASGIPMGIYQGIDEDAAILAFAHYDGFRDVADAATRYLDPGVTVELDDAIASWRADLDVEDLQETDETFVAFSVRGRQFIAMSDYDEREYHRVYEVIGNRADSFSRELLQPGISRSTALEALERYTRINITYAEVIAAETAA